MSAQIEPGARIWQVLDLWESHGAQLATLQLLGSYTRTSVPVDRLRLVDEP